MRQSARGRRKALRKLGLLLEGKEQTAGGRVVVTTLTRCLQLLLDLLRKDLAQLDTPLVERVDVPDSSLGEGHMLVVGDQCTESSGRDLLGKDGGRRAVTKEGLVRDQVFGRALGLDLLRGLADH